MKKRNFLIMAVAAMLSSGNACGQANQQWTGTWATAVEFTGPGDMPKASLSGRALRQIIHLSIGGEVMRMQFSNIHSKEPVEIKSVFIATPTDSCDIDVKTAKYLTFGGKKNVTIAPGEVVYCDVLKYHFTPLQRLSVTINYGEKTPVNASSHRGSRTTSYLMQGEVKPKTKFLPTEKCDHWYNMSCIDVQTDGTVPCVAVIGNSITDGRGSTTNMQNRWTDFMAEAYGGKTAVLNLGIGGNAVVRGGLSEPALKRFDRDVLQQAGVTSVVIFEGVNDIGGQRPNHAQIVRELTEAYTQLIAKAKAAGKKVYLATITPFMGNSYYNHFSEAARLTLNDWIRANKEVDGILDFDRVVRDPKEPHQLHKPYSDDGLHGTPAAYEAMGKYAVSVVL